jgi:hypothetical protein
MRPRDEAETRSGYVTETQHPHQPATLTWGVKQSFRGYVEGAGGVIETGAGAERTADGGFSFAAAPGEGLRRDADGRLEGQAQFLGEVHFKAHGGMLSVFLIDPRVEITNGRAVLTVADHPARDRRLEAAELDLSGMTSGEGGEIELPAALMMFGCQWLGDHYPAKTALDPVRLGVGKG